MSLLTYANYNATVQTLTENSRQALYTVASETSNSIDSFLNTNLSIVSSEAQIPIFIEYLKLPLEERGFTNQTTLKANATLIALQRKNPVHIVSYALLDANGINVLDTSAPDIGQDESETVYFQETTNNLEATISPIIFSLEEGEFHSIYFSSPIIDSSRNFLGVLRVRLNTVALQDIISQSNGAAGPQSYAVLYQEILGNYLILAHGQSLDTLFTTVIPFDISLQESLQMEAKLPLTTLMDAYSIDMPDLHRSLSLTEETPYFSGTDYGTSDQINQSTAIYLETQDEWLVTFSQPEDIFLESARTQAQTSIFMLFAFSLLVIGLAILVGQFLANPIRRLTNTAEKIAEGDLSVKAAIETNDEIGVLASTLNNMTERLNEIIGNLENIIADRTEALERRAKYLEATAEIGQVATELRSIEELLTPVTQRISQRFGFYHVGIFLIDNEGEYAVLRAANSEGGWRMLARGHKLAVGKQGVVGYVTGAGKPRLVQFEIEADGIHYKNPDLPLTRSELALPMKVGGEILGALDVQSTEEGAFTEEDITVLQILADEVAVAINNARLFEQLESNIEIERRIFGQVTAEEWSRLLRGRKTPGYKSTTLGLTTAGEEWLEISQKAMEQGRPIPGNISDEQGRYPLALPILVRGGHAIGVLETHKSVKHGKWTSDEINVLQNISEQLGIALENARLFQESQRLAQRERVVTEVAGKVWSSSDIESILKTTLQELGRSLEVSQGSIRLHIPDGEEK
jgi:GAF domain-containing protein/HAMP domain-containing protein